ncbi:MAG: glycosyltransferase family 2 protein [Bryobacterales bacterium]|nr:glycosyltransferase family 2 protein [Bryobacterales bacterium]
MEDNLTEAAPRRVSAIVTSFNNAAALRRCLTALEASTAREAMEVLVVDRGSSDGCPDMDTEFPSVNLLRLPRNFGRVKALNIGMRTGTGEFYLFLEPEMEVAPDAVERLAAALDAAPEAAAACPLAVDAAGTVLTRRHPLPLPAELRKAWPAGELDGWETPPAEGTAATDLDYFKPPAVMVRSYFMRGLRYIDERYGDAWWDLEIATQIAKSSKKVLLVPAARLTVHPRGTDAGAPAAVRGLLAADRAMSASLWCGKHYGSMQGLKFRLAATLQAMLSLFTFRDLGFHWAAFQNLLSGQKLDGSQRVM